MHTKDILAAALDEAGLTDMAAKAREGYYHDFLSPHETPALELFNDLNKAGTDGAKRVLARHMNGEFDASTQESDEWANSAEGQRALERLIDK